jgi:peptidoglycan/LPS O-acetylase OafA/YrhL
VSTSGVRHAGEGLHVPSLDGIRALSFLVVFAAHAGLDSLVPGGFGVTVFFFLSGFLITTLLRIEEEAHGTLSFRSFYARRALRILPPFYLVLALAASAAWTGLLPGGLEPRAVAAQALHLANFWIVRHGYAGQPAGTGVYWSLAVEEHFYSSFRGSIWRWSAPFPDEGPRPPCCGPYVQVCWRGDACWSLCSMRRKTGPTSRPTRVWTPSSSAARSR